MSAYELIPKLVRASLDMDKRTIEAVSLAIIKKIKLEYPDIANEIAKTLSYSNVGASTVRSMDMLPLPVDRETRYSLVKLDEPQEMLEPILNEYTMVQLEDFLKERRMIDKFMNEGIVPPNSILLDGLPGVGKTYIAKWISYRLNLPLITLDLASSISSYLGRSGQNIKTIFDYAKSQNSVLFLDELDAIAKKRDDIADLGELKRLVNVLLKELELCPSSCVIVGATNHPELLDKAIWRRFDRALTISMPAESERKKLFERHLDKFTLKIHENTLNYIVKTATQINSADICKLCEHMKRQFIMNPDTSFDLIALSELYKVSTYVTKTEKIEVCQIIRKNFPKLTYREIAQITNIPLTTVNRYLAKGQNSKEE